MKHYQEINICDQCYKNLEDWGVFNLFMMILSVYMRDKSWPSFEYSKNSDQTLRFLEKKRFVVTYEHENEIFVKCLGVQMIESKPYVCIC